MSYFCSGQIGTLRSEEEIESTITEFRSLVENLSHLNNDELFTSKLNCTRFTGSPALNLEIAQIFLTRSEYELVI